MFVNKKPCLPNEPRTVSEGGSLNCTYDYLVFMVAAGTFWGVVVGFFFGLLVGMPK